MRNIPAIFDLDQRFSVMYRFKQHGYTQVIPLDTPPLENFGGAEVSTERRAALRA
jgi:hypothetical protein